jgi:hypothetical protein
LGFNALPANVRIQPPQALFDLGMNEKAMNHVGIQLMVAGLRPQIRDDLMKDIPPNLWDASQSALTWKRFTCPSNHLSLLKN